MPEIWIQMFDILIQQIKLINSRHLQVQLKS